MQIKEPVNHGGEEFANMHVRASLLKKLSKLMNKIDFLLAERETI